MILKILSFFQSLSFSCQNQVIFSQAASLDLYHLRKVFPSSLTAPEGLTPLLCEDCSSLSDSCGMCSACQQESSAKLGAFTTVLTPGEIWDTVALLRSTRFLSVWQESWAIKRNWTKDWDRTAWQKKLPLDRVCPGSSWADKWPKKQTEHSLSNMLGMRGVSDFKTVLDFGICAKSLY